MTLSKNNLLKFYYMHLRYESEFPDQKYSNLGGVTLLIDPKETDDPDTIELNFAISVCSVNDNFSRKLGRLKAQYRYAEKAPDWTGKCKVTIDEYVEMGWQDFVVKAYSFWPNYLDPWLNIEEEELEDQQEDDVIQSHASCAC